MLTPEQLAARKGLITSSVAGACLGMSPFMSPLQAKQSILGLSTFEGSPATERGNELEEVVLRYPAKKLGLVYEPAPFRKHANGWAADSCDALYYEPGYIPGFDSPVLLGEGKTASLGMAREFGVVGTDEVPLTAWMQAHWHLIHWPEANRCVVPVLIGGWQFEFRLYYVERDTEIEGNLLDKLAQFHRDYIVGDADPPAVAQDLEWLKETYATAEHIDLLPSTPEIDALAEEYRQWRNSLDCAEKNTADARAKLEQFIGTHSGVETASGKITWRNNKPSQRIDWEHLASDLMRHLPEDARDALIAKATRTVPGPRVFRPSWKKEKVA